MPNSSEKQGEGMEWGVEGGKQKRGEVENLCSQNILNFVFALNLFSRGTRIAA